MVTHVASTSRLGRIAVAAALVVSLLALALTYWAWRAARTSQEAALQQVALSAKTAAELFVRVRIDTLTGIAGAPAFQDGDPKTDQMMLDAFAGLAGFKTAALSTGKAT